MTALLLAVVMVTLMIPITTISVSAGTVIENAISWALGIADDDSHGYSQLQNRRWGNPDYDCSTFVITAFANAGCDVEGATYTGNMRSVFENAGFTWIPKSQIDLSNSSQLVRGDILLNEANHTEIYIGNNQRVGAHTGTYDIYDRNSPGDNNGREISIYNYSNSSNWDGVLRYIDEPVITHWYDDFEPADLGNSFLARIEHKASGISFADINGNVQGMVPSTDSSQIWAFTRLSNGAYKIRNVASNGLLDVQGSGPDDNTNVITHWNDTGGSNQQFFIYFLDNGYYIKPSYTDKVLDMMEIENYNVTIWTKGNYHSPQLFNIKKVDINGNYPIDLGNSFLARIEHKASGISFADINGNVQGMVPSTDSSQIWAFTRLSNGAYKIRNVASNGLLDVQGSGPDDNTNVITHWNDTGGSNQQFFIYFLDNGYYIKPSYTDKVLDMMEIENYNVTIWTKGDNHSPQLFNINTISIGDINLDGKITIRDVTTIQRHIAELEVFTDDQLALVDTNGNGAVDINDATHLQKYLAEFNVALGKQS